MNKLFGLLIVSVAALVGCQAAKPDLTQSGAVSVQSIQDGKTHIFAVSARQYGSELVVSGSVRRLYSDDTPIIWGHVDVAAFDASGKRISAVVADQSPDTLSTGSSRSALFTAHLPVQITSGVVLKVEHHAGMPGSDGCLMQ